MTLRTVKKYIKDCIPPVLFRLFRRPDATHGFTGDYPSWQAARNASTGYDDPLILEKVTNEFRALQRNEKASEYVWPILSGLLWAASESGERLNVVDYGGALGMIFVQHERFFKHLRELTWNIVEQPQFVERGKKELNNEHVRFFTSLEDCFKNQQPNVILLSSVLQYLEDPYQVLQKIFNLGFTYIFINRTTFIDTEDRITVQRLSANLYNASYPAWLLNKEKFLNFFVGHYECISEIINSTSPAHEPYLRGFIFKKL